MPLRPLEAKLIDYLQICAPAGKSTLTPFLRIYFYAPTDSFLALLDIYAKGAKEDLTATDKAAIRTAIRAIRAALQTRMP